MNGQNKKTILLVEDDAVLAMVGGRTVKGFGYDVITAGNGKKAVEIALVDERVSLILMDIDLGKGIDGTEAAKQILEKRNLPIVFLTSHSEKEYVDRVREITRYGYVIKDSGDFVLQSSIEMAFELFEANKKVVDSEQKQRTMISSISDVIGIINRDAKIIYGSPNCRKWFGWLEGELYGTNAWLLVHPDDLELIKEEFALLLKKNNSEKTFEFRFKCKNGEYKFIELTANNLIKNSAIDGVLINFHDISERKLAEEILRDSEEKYRSIIKASPENITITDLQGRIEMHSPNAGVVFGYEAGMDFCGRYVAEFLTLAERERGLRNLALKIKGEVVGPFEYKGERKDGSVIDVEINSEFIRTADGRPVKVVFILRDITERKKAETRISKLNECFLKFGSDPIININHLVALCGELLGSTCALYNSLQDGELCSIGKWNTPPDFKAVDHPEGHICYDVIRSKKENVTVLRNLQDTGYFHSDPNVEMYKLKTYIGKGVKFEGKNVGSLCVVFQNDFIPLDDDLKLMEIIASAIGVEEDRKRGNEILRVNEHRFRNLLQNIPSIAVQGYSIEGNVRYWNKASEKLYGYSAEEAMGKSLLDLIIPPEMRTEVDKAIKQMADTGEAIPASELSLMRKDGTRVNVFSSHAIVQFQGRAKELFCLDIDLSESIKIKEALYESENKFKRMTENARDMIYRMALPDGRYEYVSPASIEITGFTPEEFYVNKVNIQNIIHEDFRNYLNEEWSKLLQGEISSFYEYKIIHKNGDEKWLFQNNVLIFDENGSPIAIEGIVTDITERKLSEEKIKKLLAEKELILREVHHRIKNNMNTLSGILYLQSGMLKDPEAMTVIQDSSSRLKSMMLLYDKLYRANQFAEISIKEYLTALIEEIASTYSETRKVKIEQMIEDISLHSETIFSVGLIVNELLTNMMKYAFDGIENALIKVYVEKREKNITIALKDNGIGLPESIDFKNSPGFGMKLVGMLAMNIGGTLAIERNEGTKFILDFRA